MDVLIKGASVCDGTGQPWFPANIAIKGDRIAAVGSSVNCDASLHIDASGLVLSPGFIDVHTHANSGIMQNPAAENYVRQGVTTVVGGNCGSSAFPIGEHLEEVEGISPALNYGTLAGLGTIRRQVMGMESRRADGECIARMGRLAREAIREGALGVSTGLVYVPGAWAGTDEVEEICRAVADLGGIYATHIRCSDDSGVIDAVSEAAQIGRRAGLPVQIAHLKVLHRGENVSSGRMGELIEHIRALRDDGVDIAWDVYPYTALRTSLRAVLIPDRLSEDDRPKERLGDQNVRSSISGEVEERIGRKGGAERIRVLGDSGRTESLGELARQRGSSPAQVAMDLVAESNPTCICHSMREEDVELAMISDPGMVASDGGVVSGAGRGHPRDFGTFPRAIGLYVRERRRLSLEDAVRKMTYMPARRFGLTGRGLIAPGMKADLVLFDPQKIGSRADFEHPNIDPDGIERVMVNGRTAWDADGGECGRSGEVLRFSAES